MCIRDSNWGYVSEWTDFDGVDFNQLLRIHRELVIQRVHELDARLAS